MPFFSQNRENYVTTLAKLFEYATDNYAKRPLSRFVEGGQEYTYDSFKHKCLELSHRFNRFGISARDKVAILSNNMPNWTVAMFSCVPFGRVTVPILPCKSYAFVDEIGDCLNNSISGIGDDTHVQRHGGTDACQNDGNDQKEDPSGKTSGKRIRISCPKIRDHTGKYIQEPGENQA